MKGLCGRIPVSFLPLFRVPLPLASTIGDGTAEMSLYPPISASIQSQEEKSNVRKMAQDNKFFFIFNNNHHQSNAMQNGIKLHI